MRLLVSWVRDFVDVQAPPEELAETLALRGFEVASVEPVAQSDAVIDFEVTANRPDCLGVLGLAREIATAYDLPFRPPSEESGALASVVCGTSDQLHVSLEDSELCPRYAAAVADVSTAVSPTWMTDRLTAVGVRPISPFVDITNYVLMELGHPMHAFDLDRLDGRELRIRRAASGERIETLDGVDRSLEQDMLVIADRHRAQAVAGVIGGRRSEVSETTRLVAFESAYFKPTSVRRTSKRLGVSTEASARFERGTDVGAPVLAIQRALKLMDVMGAGRPVGPVLDCYPSPRAAISLHLRRSRLALVLGLAVPDDEVSRILRGLGLTVEPAADGWSVAVPTFRVDLAREVDLIEEVGRHHGYDKLEPTFPQVTAAAPPPDSRIPRDRHVREVLTAAGLSEAVTFGFIENRAAAMFADDSEGATLVPIANPLSAKFETLRPSLLPGLVDAVAHNRRHGRRDVGLFEIGTCFRRRDGERRSVALAWTGAVGSEHWSARPREVDFFDAKGLIEHLARALRVPVTVHSGSASFLTPGRAAVIRAGGATVGLLGVIAPAVAESRGAPPQDRIIVAELDLDVLARQKGQDLAGIRPLPRHPLVIRDLSIVVASSLPAENIRDTIRAASVGDGAPLVASEMFDRYMGKGVADQSVSVSFRLMFQSFDRTLTDEEVQLTFDRILTALVRTHSAVQR